jgi:hypothetical protein
VDPVDTKVERKVTMRIFDASVEPHGFILLTVSDDAGVSNIYTTDRRYLDGTGPSVEYAPGTEGVCVQCRGTGKVVEDCKVFAKDEDGDDEIRNELVNKKCVHCLGSGRKLAQCGVCRGKGVDSGGSCCGNCSATGWAVPQKTKEKKT